MKIAGIAVPYGPSEYHAEIEHGALKESNGIKVPLLRYFNECAPIGHAELTETEKGIYAVLNFTVKLTDDQLIDIAKNNRIGAHVVCVKYNEQHKVVEGRVSSVCINSTSALESLEIIEDKED